MNKLKKLEESIMSNLVSNWAATFPSLFKVFTFLGNRIGKKVDKISIMKLMSSTSPEKLTKVNSIFSSLKKEGMSKVDKEIVKYVLKNMKDSLN